MLLLVGDTYQIDAIQFGNWFSVLKAFLPESAVFELTQPHRTKDERLLELWDKVRQMDDTAKEVIERESYSLKVDESLLSSLEPGEAILCLNYDIMTAYTESTTSTDSYRKVILTLQFNGTFNSIKLETRFSSLIRIGFSLSYTII